MLEPGGFGSNSGTLRRPYLAMVPLPGSLSLSDETSFGGDLPGGDLVAGMACVTMAGTLWENCILVLVRSTLLRDLSLEFWFPELLNSLGGVIPVPDMAQGLSALFPKRYTR